jgi:hypothetical protein
MKLLLTASLFLLAAFTATGNAAAAACLRGDGIDQVKMTAASQAVVTGKDGQRYAVTFVAPCGARFQNVFFVLKPENLPVCIGAGTAFPTNSRGVCVVKSVAAEK